MDIRNFALSVIAGVALASTLFAQQPANPIDQAAARQKIADQKADSDVRERVEELVKLTRTHPDKAMADLKKLSTSLVTRNDISKSVRENLTALVDGRISAINKGSVGPNTPMLDPKIADKKEANKKAWDNAVAESKEVQDTVAQIAKANELNRPKEAEALAAALASKYPNNPASLFLNKQATNRDVIAEAKYLSDLQGQRFITVMNDVQRSAIPITGDIEFPKDWKEKMLRRKKMEPELLGPEEKAILRSLEMKVEKSLKGIPFDEAIQSLSTLINQPILIEKASVDELGVDLRKPVEVPNNVDARTVLRAMLQTQGLTFIIREKTIQVMSIDKARQNMVTRSYEIRDLVQNGSTVFGAGSIIWGPYLDHQQTVANANVIINAIQSGIDPRVWKESGGPGTITFHYPSMSIIVRAPAEVHSSIGGNLKR